MKWTNISHEKGSELIKEKGKKGKVYNISMNEIKNIQTPSWAKELIESVKVIGNKVDNLEYKIDNNSEAINELNSKVDKNTNLIKQAHPELFKK